MVSDGFRWAPEMCPIEKITIITAMPEHAAFPISDMGELYFWLTMGAAVAPNIKMNVPTNSAATFVYHSNTLILARSSVQIVCYLLMIESSTFEILICI